MPFMIIGGVVLFGMLAIGLWKVILAYPIHTVLAIFGVVLLGWIMAPSTEVARLMGVTEAQMTEVVGRPTKCVNGGETITCDYADMTATFVGGRSVLLVFTRPMMEFNNNRDFYERVMAKIKQPYRDPVSASINEVVWSIPGVGTVTVTSDDNMDADRIVVRG